MDATHDSILAQRPRRPRGRPRGSGRWDAVRFSRRYSLAYLRLWREAAWATPEQERMPRAMGLSRRWYYELRRQYGLPFPLSRQDLLDALAQTTSTHRPTFPDEDARQAFWFRIAASMAASMLLLQRAEPDELPALRRPPLRLPRQPSGRWDAPRRRQRRAG